MDEQVSLRRRSYSEIIPWLWSKQFRTQLQSAATQ